MLTIVQFLFMIPWINFLMMPFFWQNIVSSYLISNFWCHVMIFSFNGIIFWHDVIYFDMVRHHHFNANPQFIAGCSLLVGWVNEPIWLCHYWIESFHWSCIQTYILLLDLLQPQNICLDKHKQSSLDVLRPFSYIYRFILPPFEQKVQK